MTTPPHQKRIEHITLAHGAGGEEMNDLIKMFGFSSRGGWTHCADDGATHALPGGKRLVFTSDAFTVDPLFFPGGNIGHLAFCGTVNDLVVMGADPLGLSLSVVIEEGFSVDALDRIIGTIRSLSEEYGVPIATGDTKVMPRGKIDGIVITTAGVGLVDEKKVLDKQLHPGDKVILSGGLGEHAVALLSQRFDYVSPVVSDTRPLIKELSVIRGLVKVAKDPTRGGIASTLNELSQVHKVGIVIDEESVPVRKEVAKVVELLGINPYELASEGRVVCVASAQEAPRVLELLTGFNPDAAIIGTVVEGEKVRVQTALGSRILPMPTGRIVPRIC